MRVGGTAANKNPRPAKEGLFNRLQQTADKEYAESSEGRRAAAATQPKTQPKLEEKLVEPAPDKPVAPSPGDKLADKPADASAPKPEDVPVEDRVYLADAEVSQKPAGALSRHYNALKKDAVALQKIIKSERAERAKGAQPDPEVAKLKEIHAAAEKRIAELSDIVRFKAFEESPEYKDQFEKPYIDSFANARSKVASLRVMERLDPETGEVRQARRPATAEDFDNLFRITDDSDAGEMAEKLFGPNAATVMYHREKVLEANQSRLTALEKFRKEGGEIEKQRTEKWQATQKQISEDAGKAWNKHVNAVLADEKQKPLFTKTEGDTEGNELLDKGYEEVREAFKVMNAMDPRLSPEQRDKVIAAHAEVFNKAAAFNRVSYLLARAQKELKAKAAALKAIEDSAPTPGNGQGRTNAPIPVSGRQGLYDRLAARGVPVR